MDPMIDPSVSDYYIGDCRKLLRRLPTGCVQVCVTSPPFWGLRSYLDEDDPLKSLEIGAEDTPDQYVDTLVEVFAEVRRVLADDGTLWLNLGDCYAGSRSGPQAKIGAMANRSTHRGFRARTKGIDPKNPAKGPGDNSAPNPRRQSGLKYKDLIGLPWMAAFALRDYGWWLRNDNIWAKPNPMPESVTDRCTRSHEYLFQFAKSESYYYNADAIAEPTSWKGQGRSDTGPVATSVPGAPPHIGLRQLDADPPEFRNKRTVWTVTPQPYEGAHFAVFPPSLIEPCILASSRPGDLVLDPFFGSGTTGEVAEKHGRRWIGFDLNRKYAELAKWRTAQRTLPLTSR